MNTTLADPYTGVDHPNTPPNPSGPRPILVVVRDYLLGILDDLDRRSEEARRGR